MALTTIGGEIQAQPLNDNFSYLNSEVIKRANYTTANYTFYVDGLSGNDNNDGLTAENAKKTIQAAINMIPIISIGTIIIDIAAATYNESIIINPKGPGDIYINGKTDAFGVPTVIFNGMNTLSYGIKSYFGNILYINDILTKNYTYAGVDIGYGTLAYLDNVRTENNGGTTGQEIRISHAVAQLNNCVINGLNASNYGVVSYHSFCSVLNSTIQNCLLQAFNVGACSSGHFDDNIVQNLGSSGVGVYVSQGGFIISSGCAFNTMNYGYYVLNSDAVISTASTTFASITTANIANIKTFGYNGKIQDDSTTRTFMVANGSNLDLINETQSIYLFRASTAGFTLNSSWNGAHLILGSYHLWVDSAGDLRIKSGAPIGDTDGTIVGTQS